MADNNKAGSIAGLCIFGTAVSTIAKIVYELQSVGLDGEIHYFHKPWAMTTLMFLGMSTCLPVALWQQHQEKQAKKAEAGQPLLATPQEAEEDRKKELKDIAMLTIPTTFDLASTMLMNVGLLYVHASVYQMLRGAEMLFAALFSVTVLRRTLTKNHKLGLMCAVAGVSVVGAASLMSGDGSATQQISQDQIALGMGLILASQALVAAQNTAEDMFMTDMNMSPLKVVGYEGLLGLLFTAGIMAPITYHLPGVEGEGLHENFLDTFAMISNSPTLQTVLGIDMVMFMAYNLAGVLVMQHSGVLFRTVLETTRTLFVWMGGLALFYGGFGLGESWNPYSWMQLGGFGILVAGTFIYRRGYADAKAEEKKLEEEFAAVAAAAKSGQEGAPAALAASDAHAAGDSDLPDDNTHTPAPVTVAATSRVPPSPSATRCLPAGSSSSSTAHLVSGPARGSSWRQQPWSRRSCLPLRQLCRVSGPALAVQSARAGQGRQLMRF